MTLVPVALKRYVRETLAVNVRVPV
jgi:hypothetical protein